MTDKLIGIINKASIKLLDLKDEKEIYSIVSDAIKELLPESYFIVSKLQPDDMNFRMVESSGFEKYFSMIKAIVGKDPFTIDFPFKDLTEEQHKAFDSRKITHFPGGIYDLANGGLSKPICKILEKMLNIGDVCAMSFCVKDKYFGGITLLIPNALIKSGIKNNSMEESIEIISNHASTALQKLRDEAELIKNEIELKQQTVQLLEGNRTKDLFFYIIAHDLIGPVGSMAALSDLLNSNYDDYTEEERLNLVNLIDNSAQNIFKLLENLLDWSRMQQGKIVINKDWINFKEIVDDSITPYIQKATEKEILIVNNIAGDIMIFIDPDSMKTVIRNLLNNALKYTNNNGDVVFNAKQIDGFVEFVICDTGVGISPGKLCKLFQIENCISSPGTNNERGTGLGLILCKEFLKRNECEISVESELGKGTTFKILIPMKK